MNVTTINDYKQALAEFVADMRGLRDDAVSVLLYGSIVRGDITPGESDLLDAHVFLQDEVFEDRERFLQALDIMVKSCQKLSQTGIPFHPYHYFSLAEAELSPAIYLPTWQTDETSTVLLGTDIRPLISSNAASHAVAASTFFEARRNMAHTLAVYLNKQNWTPQDRLNIIHSLISLKKHITIMACFALGIPSEASQAVQKLEAALPSLDTSVLHKIGSLRNQFTSDGELNNLREILREVLIFVEELHDQIIVAMRPLAGASIRSRDE